MADSYTTQETPWRDEELMRHLAVEEQLSIAQIADRLGCSNPTASRWIEKHGITAEERKPWQDQELMLSLHDEGKSREEIAEQLGCSKANIRRWMPKHLAERGDAHECPDCGDFFETKRALSLHHGQVHDGSIAGVPIVCAHCGVEKRKPACQVNEGGRSFCSNECRIAWMQERGRVETECSVCSTPLSRSRYRVETYEHQFCSEDCKAEWHSQRTGADHPVYKDRETYECNWCGDTVEKRPSYPTLENHYCNQKCYTQWISENQTGPDHPNWEGGQFPYGEGWNNAKKERVRERDGRVCQGCGMSEAAHRSEHDCKLHVHHIRKARTVNEAEERNAMDNLVALCISCHKIAEQVAPLYPDWIQ